jgi:hypothetical protein
MAAGWHSTFHGSRKSKSMTPLQEPGIPSAFGSTLRPWLNISALFVALILGFCLRSWNISWGIPGIHPCLGRYMEALHPDECPTGTACTRCRLIPEADREGVTLP